MNQKKAIVLKSLKITTVGFEVVNVIGVGRWFRKAPKHHYVIVKCSLTGMVENSSYPKHISQVWIPKSEGYV